MDIKRNIIRNFIIAMVGLSLLVGGTNAYFNDIKETTTPFEVGLMELGINKESIIQVENIIPGDTISGDFELTNDGTVDMKEILLYSSYEVIDKGENNNGDDLGDHIVVKLLHEKQGDQHVIFQNTLSELNNTPIQILEEFNTESEAENFKIQFNFVDNGENQNHFQGDSLTLKWEFEATQRDVNQGS